MIGGCDASDVRTSATPLRHELRKPEPGGYLQSPATDALIAEIADPLRRAYGFPDGEPHIYVVPDAGTDAHAIIENDIFIDYGLLSSAGSADEIGGILAHEMGHLACHHPEHNLYWDAADWALHAGFIAVALGGASWTQSLTKNAQAFVMLGGLGGEAQAQISEWAFAHAGWSRDQETKADLIGTEMLVRAKRPTNGLIAMLGKNPEADEQLASAGAPSTTSAFSGPGHPAEAARVAAIGEFLAVAHPGWHPLPDNSAFLAWKRQTRQLSAGLAYLLQAENAVGKPLALFGHREAETGPARDAIALRAVRAAFNVPHWNPATPLPTQNDPELAALADLTFTKWLLAELRLRLAPHSLDQPEARAQILALPDLPQDIILIDVSALVHDRRWKEATAELLDLEKRAGDQRQLFPLEIVANSGGTSKALDAGVDTYVNAQCLLTADINVMKECSDVEKNPGPAMAAWWSSTLEQPALIKMAVSAPKTFHRKRALAPV